MVEIMVQRELIDAEIPAYGYPGDAGMDLAVVNEWVIAPGASIDLPTGLKVQLPEGVWGRITGRSSTLRKRGLFVNEGVIDQGYRGELFIYVTNRNGHDIHIEHGTRLAQLILAPVLRAEIVEVSEVASSDRGAKGFGSTGHREWVLDTAYQPKPTEAPEEPDTHTDTSENTNGQGDTSSGLPVTSATVYLGGPIDYVDKNPEDRHRRFIVAGQMSDPHPFFDVYCPACRKRFDETPDETIARNMVECMSRDWAVFEYDARVQVSFGTPVEIWGRFLVGGAMVIVGNLGDGLFAQSLRRAGVVEVESFKQAIAFMLSLQGALRSI
jgi:dUTP pyrophosphatase